MTFAHDVYSRSPYVIYSGNCKRTELDKAFFCRVIVLLVFLQKYIIVFGFDHPTRSIVMPSRICVFVLPLPKPLAPFLFLAKSIPGSLEQLPDQLMPSIRGRPLAQQVTWAGAYTWTSSMTVLKASPLDREGSARRWAGCNSLVGNP